MKFFNQCKSFQLIYYCSNMSKFQFLCAFILVIIPSTIYCAKCPQINTTQNFDPQRYMGKWYEIQKYPIVWEAGQKCITADYELNPNGTITVVNSALYRLINYPISIRGLATPDAKDPAKLTVQFGRIGFKGNLWVLATDYQNYALAYSCTALPIVPFNIENAWILSRTPTLDQQTIDSLKAILNDVNSPTFLFYPTEQTNCPNRNSTSV